MPAPPFSDLTLGPITLHMYGLVLGLAVVAAVMVCTRTFPLVGIPADTASAVAIPGVIAGVLGARLYHVASRPAYFADHPGEILAIWKGGLGIWGGIALGVAVGAWWIRRNGHSALAALDAVAPALVIAQAIGRWGNWFNQELFGGPSTLPFALHVDLEHRPAEYVSSETFHATFLYESIWNTLVAIALLLLLTRWRTRAPGSIFAIYVAAYSAGRFVIEGLRIDEAHVFLGLRQNEWLALVLFIAGTATAIYLQRRARRAANSAA